MKVIGQITIVDMADSMVVQDSAPDNPAQNLLWTDTSATPSVLKRWNGESWEKVNDTAELEERIATTEARMSFTYENGLVITDGNLPNSYLQLLATAFNLIKAGEKVFYIDGSTAKCGDLIVERSFKLGEGTEEMPFLAFRQNPDGSFSIGA